MSKLGGAIALSAEAAIWIAGAAIIASAAGMHWNVDLAAIDLNAFGGSSPSAAASASPAPSASASAGVAIQSSIPGSSPTISPIVGRYQAYVGRPDYQFKAKFTSVQTATVAGSPWEMDQSGTISYKGGDDIDSHREIVSGAVTTFDYVNLGNATYTSKNGGPWTKSARSASSVASDQVWFAPTMQLVDNGIETKNGAQLHRLEFADPAAFNKAMLKSSSTATDAQVAYVVWVQEDGTPAVIEMDGWLEGPVNGVSTRLTIAQEFRVIATSGVTITAPV